jgi:hypothetical protein
VGRIPPDAAGRLQNASPEALRAAATSVLISEIEPFAIRVLVTALLLERMRQQMDLAFVRAQRDGISERKPFASFWSTIHDSLTVPYPLYEVLGR